VTLFVRGGRKTATEVNDFQLVLFPEMKSDRGSKWRRLP